MVTRHKLIVSDIKLFWGNWSLFVQQDIVFGMVSVYKSLDSGVWPPKTVEEVKLMVSWYLGLHLIKSWLTSSSACATIRGAWEALNPSILGSGWKVDILVLSTEYRFLNLFWRDIKLLVLSRSICDTPLILYYNYMGSTSTIYSYNNLWCHYIT